MNTVTVIGGGPAGIEAAVRLAENNIRVNLIEKECVVGGNLNNWYQLFPDRKEAGTVRKYFSSSIVNSNIRILTNTEPDSFEKKDGKFNILTSDGELLCSDAVLLATGFKVFDARQKEEYGYGIYRNVITSVELENLFSNGEIKTMEGNIPVKIGIVHCVGSRDEKCGNYHCSKVCCITGVKQAIEIKEKYPDSEVTCFYMDMRMFGPGYEEMYREAQEKYKINFIRGRLSESAETIDNKLQIKVEDTLVGRPLKMKLDMLVLLVGMEPSSGTKKMTAMLGIEKKENCFIKTNDVHFGNNLTSREGVFAAGSCVAPMNITDTITDARAAAIQVIEWFKCKQDKTNNV